MCRRGSISTNKVYQENLVAQKLIRHEAEHDALTDELNRGAFEKILSIYEQGDASFAVIMVEVGSDLKEVVREKIAQVNENLSNPTDGLPAVSLSVGVAFSDRENRGDSIFKDADKALYKVKNNGRHSCSFYER